MKKMTPDEFQAWREKLATVKRSSGTLDCLVLLEQLMMRSNGTMVCAECGGDAEVVHSSGLIKSVPFYFLCDSCDAYFEGSVGGHTYTVLTKAVVAEFDDLRPTKSRQVAAPMIQVQSLSNRRHAEQLARKTAPDAIVRHNNVAAVREP